MKKITFYTLFIIIFSLVFSGCNQLKQLQNLAKCEFRLNSVDNIKLSGVDIQNINSINQIGITDVARLSAAFLSNEFPLSLKLNIDVRNPNPGNAALSALDWIFLIDDNEMTRGIINQKYNIPANQNTIIPLQLNFDLKKVLSGKSQNAVVNFALNLAGSGNKPTRLTLRAKPSISIGAVSIPYSGYINIKTEYTSK